MRKNRYHFYSIQKDVLGDYKEFQGYEEWLYHRDNYPFEMSRTKFLIELRRIKTEDEYEFEKGNFDYADEDHIQGKEFTFDGFISGLFKDKQVS